MSRSMRKLLTVVTEAALENVLVKDFETLGVRGYTIIDARGKGSRGTRDATWGESSNIHVEIVCDEVTAAAIADHLQSRYYQDYAMILFVSEVAVLRPEKF